VRTPVGIWIATASTLVLTGSACQGNKAPDDAPKTGLAGQFERTVNDTAVMREAVTAANEVVRNATDCEVAKAHVAEARAKLDEAQQKVKTPAGQASLEALRKQVDRVADACP
jgi:hypothetical protein